MNQPSSRTPKIINLRNKGLRNTSGILIKGCVKDATSKLSIGSIPSNYQSIIYQTKSVKAFGTSQKRFYKHKKPQIQVTDIQDNFITKDSPKKVNSNVSHSVKGYGPLIAKAQRDWIQKSFTPGPGRYQQVKTADTNIQKKKKRKCYTRQKKQNRNPCEKSLQQKRSYHQSPGPGQYNLLQETHANGGWKSSFKSKLSRDGYIQKLQTPGPGQYNLQIKNSPKNIIKEKQFVSDQNKNIYSNIFKRNQIIDRQVPGPGAYQYQLPTFKPLYQRIKISSNFMMTQKDRFNNVVDKQGQDAYLDNSPNFYSYNAKSNFNEEQKLINWPCFMSQSKRIAFQVKKNLGPDFVVPELQQKKNFHFNIRGGWY